MTLHTLRRAKTEVIMKFQETFETVQSIVCIFEPLENSIVLKKMLDDEELILPPQIGIKLVQEIAKSLETLKKHEIFVKKLTSKNILVSKSFGIISVHFFLFELEQNQLPDDVSSVRKIANKM